MLQEPPYRGSEVDVDSEVLWAAHAAAPSAETTAALLEHYVPIARGIVRSLHLHARADLDREDFLQVAMMGLLEAIGRYDSTRGVSFRGFAARRVRGAVLDMLRRADLLSRREREQWQALQDQIRDYVNENDYLPDEDVLAERAGISVAHLQDLTARAQAVLSLDMVYQNDEDGDRGGLIDRLIDETVPDPGEETARQELYAYFRLAFRKLPSRQQKILYLYYYEELTLREIGEVLELTEARISQLHAQSLLALRALLAAA